MTLTWFDWLAFEFNRDDLGHAMLQVFRRRRSLVASTVLSVYGLEPLVRYNVSAWDVGLEGGSAIRTGAELRAGLRVVIDPPGAAVIEIKAVGSQ